MGDAEPTTAQRWFAAAFYAPIGLGAQIVDELPTTLAKARQQVVLARFIGKMAVDQGARNLSERCSAPGNDTTAPSTDIVREDEHTREPAGDVPAEAADDLALPDYDQLPAAHVLGKLGGLTQAERDAIERYETSHRHRRTVLSKLEQLREG